MSSFIERLICNHKYEVDKWHYTHGPNGNKPAYIEGIEICPKCGKEKYFWIDRGRETNFIKNYADKQWK